MRRLLIAFLFCLLPGAGACAAAAEFTIGVSALVLSLHECTFHNNTNVSFDFGALNPLTSITVTREAAVQFRCRGGGQSGPATYSVTVGHGENPSGSTPRMAHTENAGTFIPYSVSVISPPSPIPRNSWQNLTVRATVQGSAYQNAPAGTYADRVVVTINP